jgi:hypothetical protein
VERLTDSSELDWLENGPPFDEPYDFTKSGDALIRRRAAAEPPTPILASHTGIDAEGWEASAWILHACFENDILPGGLTHDDVRRIDARARRSLPRPRPQTVSEHVDEAMLWLLAGDGGTLVNTSCDPPAGPGWVRLPWADLWLRLSVDPRQLHGYPSHEWFSYQSWPVNLTAPCEGTLDRGQLGRLLYHLAAVSPGGEEASCVAYYGAVAVGEYDHDVLYRGALRDVPSLLDGDGPRVSPSNLWPEDRSWFVYTDWDLWGTKVSGPASLVERLENDPELEVVRLPFSSASP